eukprot:8418215-Prorocentrum_lima.AAC.1
MTSSLVGSEMCIRDRHMPARNLMFISSLVLRKNRKRKEKGRKQAHFHVCLLYTSDAADDM